MIYIDQSYAISYNLHNSQNQTNTEAINSHNLSSTQARNSTLDVDARWTFRTTQTPNQPHSSSFLAGNENEGNPLHTDARPGLSRSPRWRHNSYPPSSSHLGGFPSPGFAGTDIGQDRPGTSQPLEYADIVTVPKWYAGNIYDLPRSLPQSVELPRSSTGEYQLFVSGDYEIRLFGDPHVREGSEVPALNIKLNVGVEETSSLYIREPSQDVVCDLVDGFAFGKAIGVGLRSTTSWITVTKAILAQDLDGLEVQLAQVTRLAPGQTRIIPLELRQRSPIRMESLEIILSVESEALTSAQLKVSLPLRQLPRWTPGSRIAIKASFFYAHSNPTIFAVLPPQLPHEGARSLPILALRKYIKLLIFYQRIDPPKDGAGVDILAHDFWPEAMPKNDFSWIIMPAGRTCWGLDWHGPSTQEAWDTVSALSGILQANGAWKNQAFPSDSKVVLIGHSNGGQGVWHMSAHFPDRVAAAVPAAAYIKSQAYVPLIHARFAHYMDPMLRAILESSLTPDDNDLHLSNIAHIPLLAVHGGADGNVPTWHSRELVNILRTLEGNANLKEDPGQDHWYSTVLTNQDVQQFLDNHVRAENERVEAVPPSFTLTVSNPSEVGSLHGWRIHSLHISGRLGSMRVDALDDIVKVSPNNVQSFSLQDESVISGIQELQAILTTAGPITIAYDGDKAFSLAKRLAHDLYLYHRLDSELTSEGDNSPHKPSAGNSVVIGTLQSASVQRALREARTPFRLRNGTLVLDGKPLPTTTELPFTPSFIIGLWKVQAAAHKVNGKRVSVWSFDKRGPDMERLGPAAKDRTLEVLKSEATSLSRLRHPSILEMVEPLEETRTELVFATEPVLSSLENAIPGSGKHASLVELDEVEIQKGVLQLCKGLSFLHSSAQLIHSNICPESIIINSAGDWKISGLGLTIPLLTNGNPTRWEFPTFDGRVPAYIQRSFDYMAPEYALDEQLLTASDLYSLGCLVYAVHNKGSLPYKNHGSLSGLRDNAGKPVSGMERWDPDLQSLLRSLITRHATSRPTPSTLPSHPFFSSLPISTLNFLDRTNFTAKTREEKISFMKGLTGVLDKFTEGLQTRKILPSLLEEMKDTHLLPYILPNVFVISQALAPTQFASLVLPSLKPLFAIKEPPQNMLTLLDNLSMLQSKTEKLVFKDHVLPLVYNALESEHPIVQERALSTVPELCETVDYAEVQSVLFPRVCAVSSSTRILSVKVATLVTFLAMVKTLDKTILTQQLVPLLSRIRTKEPAVMMATLSVQEAMGQKVDREAVATLVLPQLWGMSMGPLLNLAQFQQFMSVIKKLGDRVEREHNQFLRDSQRIEDRSATAVNVNGSTAAAPVAADFEALVGKTNAAGVAASTALSAADTGNSASWDDDVWGSLSKDTSSSAARPSLLPKQTV
ncbi:hypothetical protein H1R20_g5707, partial [Candolleomyces eurysporus]